MANYNERPRPIDLRNSQMQSIQGSQKEIGEALNSLILAVTSGDKETIQSVLELASSVNRMKLTLEDIDQSSKATIKEITEKSAETLKQTTDDQSQLVTYIHSEISRLKSEIKNSVDEQIKKWLWITAGISGAVSTILTLAIWKMMS